ncbi:hypothetical protein JXA40_03900 [bacterium]|nr:hypothetical protein [candidate division CSSED10-310 bacterium]
MQSRLFNPCETGWIDPVESAWLGVIAFRRMKGKGELVELRRNPLTDQWIIYLDQAAIPNREPEGRTRSGRKSNRTKADACPFCDSPDHPDRVDIMVVRDETCIYVREGTKVPEWDVKVIAAPAPVLRIEDGLSRRGRGFYDIMEAPGAHELIIMTPEHGKPVWELSDIQIGRVLAGLFERMTDLLKDRRLGHQFAYHVTDRDSLSWTDHAVLNLVAVPFVPEKLKTELRYARQWYTSKERCLFCDICQTEKENQARGKPHGIIEETENFTAFVPFFAEYAFEIWILPFEHHADFLSMSKDQRADLAGILRLILHRLFQTLGPLSLTVTLMNQPNRMWIQNRETWPELDAGWHWSIRIQPETEIVNEELRIFNRAAGSRVNPVLPETAADHLRSAAS